MWSSELRLMEAYETASFWSVLVLEIEKKREEGGRSWLNWRRWKGSDGRGIRGRRMGQI